jgi:hypothetical protein
LPNSRRKFSRVARDRDHRRVGELHGTAVDDEDAEGAREDPLEALGRAAELVHRALALRDVVHDVGDAAAGARQGGDLEVAVEERLVEIDGRRGAGPERFAAGAADRRGVQAVEELVTPGALDRGGVAVEQPLRRRVRAQHDEVRVEDGDPLPDAVEGLLPVVRAWRPPRP